MPSRKSPLTGAERYPVLKLGLPIEFRQFACALGIWALFPTFRLGTAS